MYKDGGVRGKVSETVLEEAWFPSGVYKNGGVKGKVSETVLEEG